MNFDGRSQQRAKCTRHIWWLSAHLSRNEPAIATVSYQTIWQSITLYAGLIRMAPIVLGFT